MKNELLTAKIRGCLLGSAAGEALAAPVEGMTFHQIGRIHGRLTEMIDGRQPAGSYTDDIALMMALAECLVDNGRVDQADLARRFLEDYAPWRGFGRVFRNFINLLELGWTWREAAEAIQDPLTGCFNGSAMRVAPVGVYYHRDLDALTEAARLSSEVSHMDDLAKEACVLQATAVALAFLTEEPSALDPQRFLDTLRERNRHPLLDKRLGAVIDLLNTDADYQRVAKNLGCTVEVQNSVCTAIYAFLRSPGDFEETIVYATNLGGDCDTIAAMAGAVGGALLGESAIPGRWLSQLEARDRVTAAADTMAGQLSTTGQT